MSCIFCRIVAGEIPARRVYEDDDVLAFADLHPQAPVHILLIPKVHIESVAHAGPEHAAVLGQLLLAGAAVARQVGVADSGYRLVTNIGEDGGQSVFHLHVHVLAGRPMRWPPG